MTLRGVTAVLELAEALGAGPKPKRTVVFALFGSEEIGGYGARYFQEHPPVPVESFVANLEFEMIGRPDAAVAAHTLWLTGYERSNLGAELAAHGARLVADPHPEQHFFQRSDNYVLARKGIIAHTVSSYGLHADYHRPSDDLAHIDFAAYDGRDLINGRAGNLARELRLQTRVEQRRKAFVKVCPTNFSLSLTRPITQRTTN